MHEIAQRSLDDARHREEHAGDGSRGDEHGHEEFLGTAHGGIEGLVALAQLVDVTVDIDDGVVDNHAEYDNQGGQSHCIQLNAKKIHQPDAHGCADRQARTGDEGGTDGEEQQHDRDDDDHGDKEVAQERVDRLLHHFGLVGDTVELDAVRQRLLELGKHFIHFSSVGDNIVSLAHLYRDNQSVVAIEIHNLGRLGKPSFHSGHIA